MSRSTTLNIFISYGRRDGRTLALRLRDDLQRLGHSVWLDTNEIPGGANWAQQIEEAIEHCDVTLALMTHASYESQWCRAEQLRSLRKGKRIIPLQLQHEAEIPLTLEHLNYLDFTNVERYDAMFRDLVSDMTSGIAFNPRDTSTVASPSPYKPQTESESRADDEKRDAASFRRVLRDLRGQNWLGARSWWPYFAFTYIDVPTLVETLKQGKLTAPGPGQGRGRWGRYLRFYFRPRTPDAYFAEGFHTTNKRNAPHGMMAYLLFDMEAVLLHTESRLSNGNPAQTNKTYKTANFFSELPFERVYHDSWFTSDERDEIVRFRETQILLPDEIGLEALQLIWLRSEGEYETLHRLLDAKTWQHWRDKITRRTDYHLFNNNRLFVDRAICQPGSVWLRFNLPHREEDKGPFNLKIRSETSAGAVYEWQQEDFTAVRDLRVSLPTEKEPYVVQAKINGQIAYVGRYLGKPIVVA